MSLSPANLDQAPTMSDTVALIIAKKDDFNRHVIRHLWQHGVETLLTSSLAEAQKMVIQHLPDFVFLPYDHPDYQKVSAFARKFSRLKTTQFIAYADTDLPSAVVRLAQYQTKRAIHPPISGESFLKHIRSYIQQVPNWSDLRRQKRELLKNMLEHTPLDRKLLNDAYTWTLKRISKPDPNKVVEEMSVTTRITFASIHHDVYKGYFIGAYGGDAEEELEFFDRFKTTFIDYMREKGIKLPDIKLHQVRIRKINFFAWTEEKSPAFARSIHENQEAGVGFFEAPSQTIHPFGPTSKGMAPIEISKIDRETPPPVNFYLYSETLSRFSIIIKKGKTFRDDEYHKLVAKNISHLYLHQDEIQELLIHNFQLFIDDKIEEYSAETRVRELAEKQRMATELEIASTIQNALFPKPTYEDSSIKIKGDYRTSSECGGDWWYYSLVGDKIYFFIGDATGHGVPAALVCSAAKASVGLLVHFPNLTLANLMAILNHAIFGTSQGKILMTFFLASLNLKNGELRVCNASHESPYIFPTKDQLKKSDIVALTPKPGPRLGEGLKSTYHEESLTLNLQDRLFFYSDGITELLNPNGEQWNEQRMVRSLLKSFQEGPGIEKAIHDLETNMEKFRDNAPLADDITYFMVEFKKRKS